MNRGADDRARHSPLDEETAFRAMAEFLWRYAGHCDDFYTLVADTFLDSDGRPTDPAVWDEWLASVEAAREGRPLRGGQM